MNWGPHNVHYMYLIHLGNHNDPNSGIKEWDKEGEENITKNSDNVENKHSFVGYNSADHRRGLWRSAERGYLTSNNENQTPEDLHAYEDSTVRIYHPESGNYATMQWSQGRDQFLDSFVVANTTLTFRDGSTVTTPMHFLQTLPGDTFMLSYDFTNPPLPQKPIQSIKINSVIQELDYLNGPDYNDQGFVANCFTAGTLINTIDGKKLIEEIAAGDLIETADEGYQPVRWIGASSCDSKGLASNAKLKPVRISAGALGDGLPERDLIVSRQHRVVVNSQIAQRVFGTEETLIAAIKLIGINGVEIVEDCKEVTYFHILFDRHQIVFSESMPTESLFIGPQALENLSREAAIELMTLFPEISNPEYAPISARPISSHGALIRQFIDQHIKSGEPLVA